MVGQTHFNNCRVSKLKMQKINFVRLNKVIHKFVAKSLKSIRQFYNNFKFKWKILGEQYQKKETK